MNAVVCSILLCALSAFAQNPIRIPVNPHVVKNRDSRRGYTTVYGRFNTANMCLGTPEQCFTMMLDTGSSDTWVFSSRCEGENCQKLDFEYNSNLSTSYKEANLEKNTRTNLYGSGPMKLRFANEKIKFANIVVEEADFAESFATDPMLMEKSIDGILGLSMDESAFPGTLPLIYHLKEKGLIEKKLFTLCRPNAKEMGELIIDGTGEKYYKNPNGLAYTPILATNKFAINLTRVSVSVPGSNGQTDTEITICTDCSAVTDSGSPQTFVSKRTAKELFKALGAKPDGTGVDCRKLSMIPKLQIVVGDQAFVIDFRYYLFPNSPGICHLSIPISQDDTWLLGQDFFMGRCSVFDIENMQVGFADVKDVIDDVKTVGEN